VFSLRRHALKIIDGYLTHTLAVLDAAGANNDAFGVHRYTIN